MFTSPLHRNGSSSIVSCIFVAVGMCLPSRCPAMNVSDFTIPAFERRVTGYKRALISIGLPVSPCTH
jgi:hypothetical protein